MPVETRLEGLAGAAGEDEGLRETVKGLADRVVAMRPAFEAVSIVRGRD
ncbi:hypothetical protein [Nonomuraea sp. NPDC049504]